MHAHRRRSSEAADPILNGGIEAMAKRGTPPPRTVIAKPITLGRTGAKLL
jgi:hypothetical protein